MNSAPADPNPPNSPSSLDRIDEVCQRFESAWQAGLQPRIEDFVGPHAVTDPAAPEHELLVELVVTDLEYRWRTAAAERSGSAPASEVQAFPQRPRLEDYVARFPALGPLEQLPDDLIGDEFRIRHAPSWGDHPAVDEYIERFGHERTELAEFLRGIEQELAAPRPPTVAEPNAAAPVETRPGTTLRYFGDYELLEEIGRGGMGVVFRARQVSLNRIVAVKMILAAWLAEDKAVQRFYAEAESAAKLDHAGIVPVYEVGQHEGQHYFSMGYVDGQSLAKRLAAQGPLPPREAAELVREVAEAMHYAHGQGVVHRDLKPHNILLDRDGQPRVTDFGLAKQLDSDAAITTSGELMGTAAYMPPEQAAGHRDALTTRSDIYSLGATLYETLTGRPPFLAATREETLRQVAEREPLDPRLVNPQVPRDLAAICLKCLEKPPQRRYATAQDMADDLARFLEGRPTIARPTSRLEKTIRWCRRRPAVAGLVAAVLLLLLSLAGVWTGYSVRLSAANRGLSEANQSLATAYANQVRLTNEKEQLAAEKEQEARRARAAEHEARTRLAENQRLAAKTEFQNAEKAAQRGDWRMVLDHLAQAEKSGGKATPRQVLLGALANQSLNQGPAARQALESLQTRSDLSPAELAETKLMLGDLALAGSGDYEAGLELIREAQKLGLPKALDEYAAGLLCEKVPEARSHFEKALELDAFYESAHAALLVLLAFSGQDAQVQRRAESLELLFPDDPTPHIARAMSRLFQGDRSGAETHLKKVYEDVNEEDRADIEKLMGLYSDIASAMKSLGGGESPSLATALSLMARAGVTYAGGKNLMARFANPNLPYLRSSFGRLPTALFQHVTFRPQAAITELETIVQHNPDGFFYFLLGEMKAIQITSSSFKESDLSELYPIFRQAVESPSAFPFHRRQAALWMVFCAGRQATPGEDCFDPEIRERTIAAISDYLKYDALTPLELGRLALISSRAKLPDLGKLVCDRWMHDHPADMEAVRWAMQLALKEQHYVRVLDLFQALPADAARTADLQSLADAARKNLRELAARLPQEPPAKEAKPQAADAPARP